MSTLPARVKAFRKAKGWSTTELAKRVPTSRQNIDSLEAGRVRLPSDIFALSQIMELNTDELLKFEPETESHQASQPCMGDPQLNETLAPMQNDYDLVQPSRRALILANLFDEIVSPSAKDEAFDKLLEVLTSSIRKQCV